MVHEIPWVLITHNELMRIEEGLGILGKEIPAKSSRHRGALAGAVNKVRERQP